jgi:hypothetical protein
MSNTITLTTGETVKVINVKKTEGKRWTEFTLTKDITVGEGDRVWEYKKGEVFKPAGEVEVLQLSRMYSEVDNVYPIVPKDAYVRKVYVRLQEVTICEII